MTAYPPTPPTSPYGTVYPYRPTSRAARTAGMAEIVIGSAGTLLAFCLLAGTSVFNSSRLPPEQLAELQKLGVAADSAVRVILLVAGVCIAIPAIAYVILGAFVWRGSKRAVLISLILTVVLALFSLVMVTQSIFAARGTASVMCLPLAILAAILILGAMLARARQDLRRLDSQEPYGHWQMDYYGQVYPATPLAPPPSTGPEDLPPPPVTPL